MLFKLKMAFSGEVVSAVRAGTIVKWHKREGESVDYGDDLFDMEVVEVGLPETALVAEEQALTPDIIARAAARQFETKDLEVRDSKSGSAERRVAESYFVRVRSSDRGVLRKIHAREGDRCEIGDLLAVLTSDVGETIDVQLSSSDSIFRTVANLLHSERGSQGKNEGSVTEHPGNKERYVGSNYLILRSETQHGKRVGLYVKGGFDINSIFACTPFIQSALKGTCCIFRDVATNLRSDVLLQTLRPLPRDWTEQTANTLGLHPDYFHSQTFDAAFTVDGPDGPETFSKTVVILSILPDIILSCFRHKQHGFVCDPDGYWLREQFGEAFNGGSTEKLNWLRAHFSSEGKISVGDFVTNFGKVVELLKNKVGARVLVMNAVTTTPGNVAHNYQFMKDQPAMRRLQFNLALVELSRKLDLSIVDVDRIVKRVGIRNQMDWTHTAPAVNLLIAQEAFRIMRDLEVFS